jgi:hypothetical protein
VTGFRHHPACHCGCQHVVGVDGQVVERVTVPGVDAVIVRFDVPSRTGPGSRTYDVAYLADELAAAS